MIVICYIIAKQNKTKKPWPLCSKTFGVCTVNLMSVFMFFLFFCLFVLQTVQIMIGSVLFTFGIVLKNVMSGVTTASCVTYWGAFCVSSVVLILPSFSNLLKSFLTINTTEKIDKAFDFLHFPHFRFISLSVLVVWQLLLWTTIDPLWCVNLIMYLFKKKKSIY